MTENQKTQALHNAFFGGHTPRGKRWIAAKRRNKAGWFKKNPNKRTQTYGRG